MVLQPKVSWDVPVAYHCSHTLCTFYFQYVHVVTIIPFIILIIILIVVIYIISQSTSDSSDPVESPGSIVLPLLGFSDDNHDNKESIGKRLEFKLLSE